jgi:hypothetical protein
VFIREKKELYLFSVINKTVIKQYKGIIRHEIILIRITIGKYIKKISLDIIKISSYQIIFSIL